jgi:hypothetical protein
MKPRKFSAIGGWQSFLFCIGMYAVALFFSIFVCSSIFYAVNARSGKTTGTEKAVVAHTTGQQLASVAR